MQRSEVDEKPFFSIVMPVFNGEAFIGEALKSILNQNFYRLEIIIIDGGSTDSTAAIVEAINSPKIMYQCGKDFGLNHAVNKGVIAARGKFILWLNSDDFLYPGSLQKVHDILDDSNIDVLYGNTNHVDINGVVMRSHGAMDFDYKTLVNKKNYIPTQSCFFRKDILSHVGLFDCSLVWCGDWDMWKKIAATKKYKFHFCNETIAAWRHHLDTITSRGGSRELYQRSLEVSRNSRKYSTQFISSIEMQNLPYLVVGFLGLRELWRKLKRTHA